MHVSQPDSDLIMTAGRHDPQFRTVRPYSAYRLHGIVSLDQHLLAIDSIRGYLLQVDPATDNTSILNPYQAEAFVGVTGLALWEQTLWFTQENRVSFCSLSNFTPQQFVDLSYPVDGVAIWQDTIYICCQKAGSILVYNRTTGQQITKFYAPGVGPENLMIRGEELWVCDRTEQTVYCLDRATGVVQFKALTPFEHPTGLAFHPHPQTGQPILYVTYASEEAYVRDDPNSDPPQQLAWRDLTLIHPLHLHHTPASHYTLSNGFLIEMSYVEEIDPLEAVDLQDVEWRMALPAETHRQTVRQIEAIGLPLTEEQQDDQRVAIFKFNQLKAHESRVFGWKAILEVWGIKYHLNYEDVEKVPPLSPDLQTRYLIDDDDLAMNTDIIRRAAREAVGTETNLLRKVLRIRNTVYDRLSYSIKPSIDTPDVVWERGKGSCGEYVGVMLALLRLNGIACRTVGRYKCPKHTDHHFVPLQPDFNHVWLEFYVPGIGWLPMESNPDDIIDGGPYPTRFFMGLPWYHAEMGKGISFETVRTQGKKLSEVQENLSLGSFALNHIRFTILRELAPVAGCLTEAHLKRDEISTEP
jgi:hypothetical protein